MSEAPAIKSRWHRVGNSSGNVARVMAVADGWVMVRFKGAMPFTVHVNQWDREFVAATPLTPKVPTP